MLERIHPMRSGAQFNEEAEDNDESKTRKNISLAVLGRRLELRGRVWVSKKVFCQVFIGKNPAFPFVRSRLQKQRVIFEVARNISLAVTGVDHGEEYDLGDVCVGAVWPGSELVAVPKVVLQNSFALLAEEDFILR
ncbi:hypothetical protein NE237_007096 [Protea cynaroides]|uniref:Uncharacterized protein n=1 Tax=Protea cynaroides TaxID=273540 RepID=A0A9Q0KNS1_9MAGN|nr:hypothetical protein NE237_007096 [Protea cynaroides]